MNFDGRTETAHGIMYSDVDLQELKRWSAKKLTVRDYSKSFNNPKVRMFIVDGNFYTEQS